MRSHAARRGYKLDSVSRPVCTEDFFDFDLIIGMDNRNIDDLNGKPRIWNPWKRYIR